MAFDLEKIKKEAEDYANQKIEEAYSNAGITDNQQKALDSGLGPLSSEAADKAAASTPTFDANTASYYKSTESPALQAAATSNKTSSSNKRSSGTSTTSTGMTTQPTVASTVSNANNTIVSSSPVNIAPDMFGGNMIEEASRMEQYHMSAVGRAIDGIWSGLGFGKAVDESGRDLQTQDSIYSTGKIIGYIGAIANIGELGSMIESWSTKGSQIVESGNMFSKADIASKASPITNSLEAQLTTQTAIKVAQTVSPRRWTSVVGWASTIMTVGLATYFSQSATINAVQDTIQGLTIKASKLIEIGEFEAADEVIDMAAEMRDFTNSIGFYIPGYNYFTSASKEADALIDSQSIENKLAREKAEKDLVDAIEKRNKQDELINKISGMTQEQIASDPEIKAFADANPFSPVNDYYNSALKYLNNKELYPDLFSDEQPEKVDESKEKPVEPVETEQTQYTTRTYPSEERIYEPPSNLNFGLIRSNTGENKLIVKDENGNPIEGENDLSLYLFGIPFGQLTDAQKQQINLLKIGGN